LFRYIRWQAISAVAGTLFLGALLLYLAYTTTTLVVPDYGGTYVEGVAGSPSHINPLLSSYNQVDEDLVSLVFSGLTKVNETGEVVPDLAKSWEISEDGLTYTFNLRRDVRWHDGTTFTADDVVFTILALQDPEFQGRYDLATLWRTVMVEKKDNYTVSFNLREPFAPFLVYTSIGLLPKHILEDVPVVDLSRHPFNLQPVGTGPFRLLEASTEHALLEANPYWYGHKPYLSRVEFKFYPDYESIVTAYKRGEVEGISQVILSELDEIRREEKLNLFSAPVSGYTLIFLNLKEPIFQEKEVRQALLLAIDRQRIIDQIMDGQGLVATSPILPTSWAYNSDLPHYDYSPQRAMDLLTDAGWVDANGDGIREKDGTALSFALLTDDDPLRLRIIEEVARELAEVGVSVRTEKTGSSGVRDALRLRTYTAILYPWADPTGDPDLYVMWHSTQIQENGQNYSSFSDPEVDQMLERARLTYDGAERKALYLRFQETFAEEVPALLLFYPIYNYAVDTKVNGVQLAPLLTSSDRFRSIADWYVNTKRVILSETQGG
jgi:peptide/nickel transport system substrate-binding protein